MLPDIRKFNVSKAEINLLMEEFGFGKAIDYGIETNINHTHSNKLIFATSDKKRKYAFKFYLKRERPLRFYIQFLVISKLISSGFRTNNMYLTKNGKPFYKLNNIYVAAYEMLDATPISNLDFKKLDKKTLLDIFFTLRKRLDIINDKTNFKKYIINDFKKRYDLKNILKQLPKKDPETQTVKKILKKIENNLSKTDNGKLIRFVHNNISLNNILLKNKTYYIIDFDHLTYDYHISDFASFITNLYINKIDQNEIDNLTLRYLKKTKDSPNLLTSLVSLGLIKEYIKISGRLDNIIKDISTQKNRKTMQFNIKKLISEEKDYLSYLSNILNNLNKT